MRKRLRLALVLTVVLLFAGVAALVGRSLWQQYQFDLARKGLELLPGVSQHIKDFRRVKVDNGRKVWEVAADDAQYFADARAVVVRGAVLQWYLKDGRVVGLKGPEGRIVLAGRDVSRIELSGGIQVSLADYVVRAEDAVYEEATARISAPGTVQIVGKGLHLTGDGMEVDIEAQRLLLLRDVAMRIEPSRAKVPGPIDAPS